MLPLLWWIDVSANSQYYCSSIVVAAFPWMFQCPCKNELFSIAGPSNWSLHKGLAIPWSIWSIHPSFDVSTPPLMFPLLLWCCQSSTNLPLLLWCCCSLFYVAVPAFMLLLLLLCCHFTMMCHSSINITILSLMSCYSSMLLLFHWGCLSTFNVPENVGPGSSIWDQRSGVWGPGSGWPISELHFAYLVTPHNVDVPLWKYSTFKWYQKRNLLLTQIPLLVHHLVLQPHWERLAEDCDLDENGDP